MSTDDMSAPSGTATTATTTTGAGNGLLDKTGGTTSGSPAARAATGDEQPSGQEATAPPGPEVPAGLAALGLTIGEKVRWRKRPGARWRHGAVVARERDGSVGVRDERGASRALRIDRLEVPTRGPRGAATWEALEERAARLEATLFAEEADPTEPPGEGSA